MDEEYAKTTGVKTNSINILLTLLTAITVVLSVKVVGVMLVSALLILPAVTALQLAKRFQTRDDLKWDNLAYFSTLGYYLLFLP